MHKVDKLYDIQLNILNQISVKDHAVLGTAIRVTITLAYSLEVSTSNLTMDILSKRSILQGYAHRCIVIRVNVNKFKTRCHLKYKECVFMKEQRK